MLQNLISLQEDQMEIVLCAVVQWCVSRNVDIESVEGHRAISVAIDTLGYQKSDDFAHALFARLDNVTTEVPS